MDANIDVLKDMVGQQVSVEVWQRTKSCLNRRLLERDWRRSYVGCLKGVDENGVVISGDVGDRNFRYAPRDLVVSKTKPIYDRGGYDYDEMGVLISMSDNSGHIQYKANGNTIPEGVRNLPVFEIEPPSLGDDE
ncbi:MAG: hypothetical protein ABIG30_01190 [Candidatus Aenigmatarchaeota archaeon]